MGFAILILSVVVSTPTAFAAGATTNAINAARQAAGLSALHEQSQLSAAATQKATYLAQHGIFSHQPNGQSTWQSVRTSGYAYSHVAENLALGVTGSAAVTAWMNSAPHRANILNGVFTDIGIGRATGTFDGQESVVVVAIFATPKEQISAPVAPATIQSSPVASKPRAVIVTPPAPQPAPAPAPAVVIPVQPEPTAPVNVSNFPTPPAVIHFQAWQEPRVAGASTISEPVATLPTPLVASFFLSTAGLIGLAWASKNSTLITAF